MKQNTILNENIPIVSVIIPVYNDANQLLNCLTALSEQSYSASLYNIIVIDNGSTDGFQEVINRFPNVLCLEEVRPGSYYARNTGIKNAIGEVVAFTDSDCIPKTDWLINGVRTLLSNDNIGLVAGEVEMTIEHSGQASIIETYQLICGFNQKTLVKERHFGVTANLFTRKSVLEEVGVFNSNLKSGGDLEWGRRVFAKGFHQKYDEKAIVIHPVRTTLKSLIQQARRVTGGRFAMQNLNEGEGQLNEVSKPIGTISNSIRILWNHVLADTYSTKVGLLLVGFILRLTMFFELIVLKSGFSTTRR